MGNLQLTQAPLAKAEMLMRKPLNPQITQITQIRVSYKRKHVSRKGAEAQSNRKVRHDRLNAFLNRCNLRNLWMVICTRRTQPVAVRRV